MSTSTESSTAVDEQKSQILQQEYNRSQKLIQELDQQSQALASQAQEHIIVKQTLNSIPPTERQGGRKCFKMIGGVLVEKSIDEVLNILSDEQNQLLEQKKKVDEELKSNRTKLESWITKNKIKIVKG
ncbi:GIM4 [Candida oxycetoniae]|uniref:GIM4 n=1 Tax=Candida oxycetoniae TaxID=497107 RepID=A0AAI9SY99_9ASCO|nr:GIM4 [Candida oxycetoniae]KAI3405398.2 GIM4 [Candida oxycetoniae]